MRIAIANVWVAGRSGTEIVTAELAKALARRGHDIFVFTSVIGETGQRLIADGIAVVDDLAKAPFVPDVVHGNHNVVLVQALLHFPKAVGVYVCHDATLWQNRAPDMSRIRKFVAVDQHCRERVERDLPRTAGRVVVVHNAVDLDVFRARAPLPATPAKALILTKNLGHIDAIEAVCRGRGIAVDVIGPNAGPVVDDLPVRLAQYDVVFATARMAIEAMAVGCAVIVCDARGFAGLATPDNAPAWRERNFGASILTHEVTEERVAAALDAYDPQRCAAVTRFIVQNNSLENACAAYEAIYCEALEQPVGDCNESAEVSAILRDWLPNFFGYAPVCEPLIAAERQQLIDAANDKAAQLQSAQHEIDLLRRWQDDVSGRTWVKAALRAETVLNAIKRQFRAR